MTIHSSTIHQGESDSGSALSPKSSMSSFHPLKIHSLEELNHLNGIILIDKPRGPSSHQVAAWVRELLGTTKVGHTGTLDPAVSGVLVVLLGRAVRLTSCLHLDEKEYVCLLRLHHPVDRKKLDAVLLEFTGKVYQRPPRRSAVKRALRIREIHSIECLDSDGSDVLLLVRCDSGTYIRSLCHHIGLALGVGGHMQELRRTISGGFSETQTHTLHSLADAMDAARNGDFTTLSQMILPVEVISSGIPCVSVKTTALNAISHGARISSRGIVTLDSFQKDDFVAVLNEQKIVCIGKALTSSSCITPGAYGLVIAPFLVFRDLDP